MKRKNWLWALAALPLIGVPLIAQEAGPQPAAAQNPPAAAQPDPAAPDSEQAEPASQAPPEPADEHISADNSLSFPVDI